MSDGPFKTPVTINLGSGEDRDVRSVKEALDVLSMAWSGEKRGAMHAEAVRSCRLSLDGRLPTEKAREAFSAAAWEAGIFVSDLRRMDDPAP